MPEHPDQDLDDRIRQLVTRAVSDAPAPPDVGPNVVPLTSPTPSHRRWWIGGGAAVLAAAAVITALVLVGDRDERISTPSETVTPTVEPTTVPTSTPAVIPTTVPAPAIAAVPPTTLPPATSAAPSTTAPSTTVPPTTTPPTTAPAALPSLAVASGILTAGPNGVTAVSGGQLAAEPVVIALATPGGAVIVQRHAGYGFEQGWADADTMPQVVGPDGSLAPLFGGDWGGAVVLHDAETVAGRQLLLYSVQVAMSNPDTASETLHVVDLGTEERTEIAQIGGWEWGTGRLHLATTGLIVGESTSGAATSILIEAVPRSPADASGLPTPPDLGLQDTYPDCDCPHAFTVTPNGDTVGWVEGGGIQSVTIGGASGHAQGPLPDGFVTDLDFAAAGALLSFSESAPVLLPLDGSDPTTLDGAIATAPPAGWPD